MASLFWLTPHVMGTGPISFRRLFKDYCCHYFNKQYFLHHPNIQVTGCHFLSSVNRMWGDSTIATRVFVRPLIQLKGILLLLFVSIKCKNSVEVVWRVRDNIGSWGLAMAKFAAFRSHQNFETLRILNRNIWLLKTNIEYIFLSPPGEVLPYHLYTSNLKGDRIVVETRSTLIPRYISKYIFKAKICNSKVEHLP